MLKDGLVTRFSFSSKELNNWKGRIAERLTECYFEQILIPKLKKEEGWNFIILVLCPWFSVPGSSGFNPDFKNEKVFFLSNCLFPTHELLNSFKKMTKTLSNWPDGFLVKLKKTGKSKVLKECMKEMDANFSEHFFGKTETSGFLPVRYNAEMLKKHGFAIQKQLSFNIREHDKNERLQVVEGDVEIIEVKCDKGNLAKNQIQSYRNVVNEGYPLRFFLVKIISFRGNQFEIKEKLITNSNEIRTRIDID